LVHSREHNIWTLGGLSLLELLRRTARESWQDSVFGQGGRMAFYHFLAIFPSFLLFLAVSAHIPHGGGYVQDAIQDLSRQVLPERVSQLLENTMIELNTHALPGIRFASVCAGALWAALNATWAMIYGLNRAYEVKEQRSWLQLGFTIAGLTLALAVTCCIAAFLILCAQAYFTNGMAALRVVEWLVLLATVSLWFAVLYRFAPDLRDQEWRWSTPGALCALILWVGATFTARFYFDHVNDYSRAYGHLNGVVMLLLWLYVSNGAILIGGEMNSEIEKAAARDRQSIAAS
jgi:membrane protein